MKETIIIFLIGLLSGAIISTASIFFYTLATYSSNSQQTTEQAPGNFGPGGQNGQMGGGGTPPEMPSNNQ